jgi:hypothetical protein
MKQRWGASGGALLDGSQEKPQSELIQINKEKCREETPAENVQLRLKRLSPIIFCITSSLRLRLMGMRALPIRISLPSTAFILLNDTKKDLCT